MAFYYNSMNQINIAIGYDPNEVVAFHTCSQSILEHTSIPVNIQPLIKKQLNVYTRQRTESESTDFSLTRFLVPYLNNFEGWTLYCDCDFIFLEDLASLWAVRDDRFAVMVCKHEYAPKREIKFLGQKQKTYEKKNWSSLMLFNNSKCRELTPEYVNTASGLDLHQFKWLADESLIGNISLDWNYLSGEDNQSQSPKGIHFTNGGPWFSEGQDALYASSWKKYRDKIIHVENALQRIIEIDGEYYEVIPSPYKRKGSTKDYTSLKNLVDHKIYILKKDSLVARDRKQQYSTVETHYLGNIIASYFDIPTQSCRITSIDNEKYLVSHDVRSWPSVIGMEPLSFHSQKVSSETRDLVLLSSEMKRITGEDVNEFMLKTILFDFYIGNNQRDARSFRVFDIDQEKFRESNYNPVKNNYEFLIENNFGSAFWSECKNPLYTIEEYKDFILKNNLQDVAKDFFEKVNPTQIKELIMNQKQVSEEVRIASTKVFEQQFEKMLELEDFLEK